MRILIAPDSFKGSLSAVEAAAAIRRAVDHLLPEADVLELPMADGGEGTATVLAAAGCGRLVTRVVTGPLGEPVPATFAVLDEGPTAVIEMATASGLTLVPPERRNPLITTTFGTGELIRAALDEGCRRLLVAIGGSATNDGGAGMAEALGVRFLDANRAPIPRGGAGLARLEHIDISGLDPRIQFVDVSVACDVTNPLYGPQGASRVYGPQKGARPTDVNRLDRALARYARVLDRDLGKQVADLPGAGAAGGMGAGLVAFLNAAIQPGAELVLDVLQFDKQVQGADLVITGEGRSDIQTLNGKVPWSVARRAAKHGVHTLIVSGSLGSGLERLREVPGIIGVYQAAPPHLSEAEAMARAAELLEGAVQRALRETFIR